MASLVENTNENQLTPEIYFAKSARLGFGLAFAYKSCSFYLLGRTPAKSAQAGNIGEAKQL
ncbi:hypothetical protein [Rhizobium sp. SSA_523]|uniref:hypothetical protein n=1 Tax=Rhizobium sp. SSA_523 TaxID=2952477 RepID=UPI002091B55F|nr:hypothetical protein [Rhizobium sp. SSA_523]MCO5733334.1 hypothetical protein [Rhizobium sp. SSA_523]WKC21687.1 hypothetical protein QTJ18_07400 [Rhizobium sp. SSA_523]